MSGKRTVKVLVGIPNEGGTQVDAYDNRMIMFQHLGKLEVLSKLGVRELDGTDWKYPEGTEFEFSLGTVGNVLTPIARERIAEIAVENGFDYLFFVDDDMICPEDLFLRLYNHRKPVVAALAFTRFWPHKPVIYTLKRGFDPTVRKEYYVPECWFNYPKDTLVECDAVGFGAVLIDVAAFREMKRPWFTAATGKGEDIQFCFDAKNAGFKVYMDTATKLGHLGPPRCVDESTYEAQDDVKTMREEESSRRLNGKQV